MLSRRAQRGRYRKRWHAGHIGPHGIRVWHPGFWLAMVVGLLRHWGVLRHLCPGCGGAGRLVKAKHLRRLACPACKGTGRATDDWNLMQTLTSIVNTVSGLSTRRTVQDSIAASPAGNHEVYPKGSIVICVSCAAPIYRLERGIYVGEKAGRSAEAYRPVRVQDLLELRGREDLDAGLKTIIASMSTAQMKRHCDRIRTLVAGDPLVCPSCTRSFVAVRSSANPAEAGETLDRAYVIELLTVPPVGQKGALLHGGKVRARRIAGIRR